MQLGVYNDQSIISFSTMERTVMYREKFAGMYSSWAFSFAQVRSRIMTTSLICKHRKLYHARTNQISLPSTGCNRDSLCLYPSVTLYNHRLPNNWLLLDSIQTPMVPLHYLLLSYFLPLRWIAACFSNPKCASSHHIGIIFQHTTDTIFRIYFTCTCKSGSLRITYVII